MCSLSVLLVNRMKYIALCVSAVIRETIGHLSADSIEPRFSPALVISKPVFSFPQLANRDVAPSSLPTRDNVDGNEIAANCLSMSDVLSPDTSFYVDDRRFSNERPLASFRDYSFDNDDFTKMMMSKIPVRRRCCSAPSDAEGGASAVNVSYWPAGRTEEGIADNGGPYDNNDNAHIKIPNNVNNGTSSSMTVYTSVVCQPCEKSLSTTSVAEILLFRTTVANCSSLSSQSIVANCQQSPSAHLKDLVDASSWLCRLQRCENGVTFAKSIHNDDATSVKHLPSVDEDTAQDICNGKETRRGAVTHRNVFNKSLCMSPNHVDILDSENHLSLDDNIEIDKNTANANGCSHQVCPFPQKLSGDTSKYDVIFDSSASIYDRLDKYYGLESRKKATGCSKELSPAGLRVQLYNAANQAFSDGVRLSTTSEERFKNGDVAVYVKNTTISLPSSSATTQPCISYPAAGAPRVIEYPATNGGLGIHEWHFQNSNGPINQYNGIKVRTSHQRKASRRSRGNGAETISVISTGLNCQQYDENTSTAVSATLQTTENSSLVNDGVIVDNDLSTLATPNDNYRVPMPTLACAPVPADNDRMTSCPENIDAKTQIEPSDASKAMCDLQSRGEDCFHEDLADFDRVLMKDSSSENRQQSDNDARHQLSANNIHRDDEAVVSSDQNLVLCSSKINDTCDESQRLWNNSVSPSVVVNIEVDESKRRFDDNATQLTAENIGSKTAAVASDRSFGDLKMGDVCDHNRKSQNTASPSVAMDAKVDDKSRRRRESKLFSEHQRRLEALKAQLTSVRPVAPTSSLWSIDSDWNAQIVGKLTPAARSRSAVWTPYDAIFYQSTTSTTRPRAAASDRLMWRTTSLQTLPSGEKYAYASGLCQHSTENLDDFGTMNKDKAMDKFGSRNRDANVDDQAVMDVSSCPSEDKSKSLSDLRLLTENDDERRLQHSYEMGLIGAGLNNEKTTAAAASLTSAVVPLRPLPSEEFIRRSLERLNLPEWYLNSSALRLRKKVVDTGYEEYPRESTTKYDHTASCRSEQASRQSQHALKMPLILPRLASFTLTTSTLEDARAAATAAVSERHYSKVSDDAGATYRRFAAAKSLQPDAIDPHESIQHAADASVFSPTKLQTNGGEVVLFRSKERRRKKKSTAKADEDEECLCRHGKMNSAKCSRCRRELMEVGSSPPRYQANTNKHVSLKGDVNYYNNCSYATTEKSTATGKIGDRSEIASRRKSNSKHSPVENDQNEVIVASDYDAMVDKSSYNCQEMMVNGDETVENNELSKLSTLSPALEKREAHTTPPVRPRTLRIRRVKAKTRSKDVEVNTDVSNVVSKQKPSKSSENNNLLFAFACDNSLHEMIGYSPRNRTRNDPASIASTTNGDALETNGFTYTHDAYPAENSDHKLAVENDRIHERKVQRRRRRQQQENIPDVSAMDQPAINGGVVKNDRLTAANGDHHSVIDSDYSDATERTSACERNHVQSNVELREMPSEQQDSEQQRKGKIRRRRRRTDINALLSSEQSPSGEYLQINDELQDQSAAADLTARTTSVSNLRRVRRRFRSDRSSCLLNVVKPQIHGTDDAPTRTQTLLASDGDDRFGSHNDDQSVNVTQPGLEDTSQPPAMMGNSIKLS